MSKNYVEESISLCVGTNDCCSGMNTISLMTALHQPNDITTILELVV